VTTGLLAHLRFKGLQTIGYEFFRPVIDDDDPAGSHAIIVDDF
jgi:hypothetical protein